MLFWSHCLYELKIKIELLKRRLLFMAAGLISNCVSSLCYIDTGCLCTWLMPLQLIHKQAYACQQETDTHTQLGLILPNFCIIKLWLNKWPQFSWKCNLLCVCVWFRSVDSPVKWKCTASAARWQPDSTFDNRQLTSFVCRTGITLYKG